MSAKFRENYQALAWYWWYWSKHRDAKLAGQNADDYLRGIIGNVSASDKNRFRDTETTTPQTIKSRLADPDTQRKLIDRFDLPPHFFQIDSLKDLVEALPKRRSIGTGSANHPELQELTSTSYAEGQTYLGPIERQVLQDLSDAVLTPKKAIVEWPGPFASGASWIARQLHHIEEIRQHYTRIFHITVDYATRDADEHLSEVYRLLGIAEHETLNPSLIANIIRKKDVLLVFHRYEFATEREDDYHTEVFQALKDVFVRCQKAPILIITSPRPTQDEQDGVAVLALTERLRVPVEQRFILFREQFKRFLSARGSDANFDRMDSRLKRARAHYNDDSRDVRIYPAGIKLRALFFSNFDNPSYYDPTLGFRRLANLPDLDSCPDIKSILDDTEAYLNSLTPDGKSGRHIPEMQILRLASTGLYWLNTSSIPIFVEKLNWPSAERALEAAFSAKSVTYGVIGLRPDLEDENNDRLVMSMGLKAIVQDHWMKSDSKSRKIAHRILADHLFFERTGVDLGHEYPMITRHNDKDTLFISEVIRHLVRSLERFDHGNSLIVPSFDSIPTEPTAIGEKWKLEPGWLLGAEKAAALHPDQLIWRICYTYLYDRLLMNGKERRLTHHHGAYALRLEVLALLGGRRIGDFHPSMPEDLKARYLADLGFTLIDVGRMPESLNAFTQVHETHRNSFAEPATLMRSSLDLAVIYAEQEQTDNARRWLNEAKLQLNKLAEENVALRNRYNARLAHIIYLEGKEPQAAAGLFRDLEQSDKRPTITGQRAHTYIAALALFHKRRKNSPSNGGANNAGWTRESALAKAMEVCTANLFSCAFAKQNHEALGFAISLAHLFREQRLIDAAEATLDQVYLDILKYGCSERTYLEFLREAGRVLRVRHRYARSYAGYLAPCIARASAGGMTRIARTATVVALKVLHELSEASKGVDAAVWSARLESELNPPSFLKRVGIPRRRRDEPLLDPHFSYDLIDITEWVRRLGSKEEIDREIARLETSGGPAQADTLQAVAGD